jgi:hypothetical protein
MAFSADDLTRIEKAMAQGVLTVTMSDGRSVTFSSFQELHDRYAFIKRSIAGEQGRQRMFARFRKGVSP